MISFRCQHCHEPLEAPSSMAGEKIQCPICQRWSKTPKLNNALAVGLARIWYSSPTAFRNGFLGALGVIVAIWLVIQVFIPNSFNQKSPINQPQINNNAQNQIAQNQQEPESVEPPLFFTFSIDEVNTRLLQEGWIRSQRHHLWDIEKECDTYTNNDNDKVKFVINWMKQNNKYVPRAILIYNPESEIELENLLFHSILFQVFTYADELWRDRVTKLYANNYELWKLGQQPELVRFKNSEYYYGIGHVSKFFITYQPPLY